MGKQQATISNVPIACTLSAADYRERLADIAELARDALRSYERDGLVLRLRYDGASADRVKGMVRREQECCAYLIFELREEDADIVVTISAPEEARVAAEAMFDQFIAPKEAGTKGPARVALACAGAAVACGAACIAPLALPAVVLAGAGTMLAWLTEAHSWMTILAIVAVAVAWLWIWFQAVRSNMRPAASTLNIMSVATLLLALAVAWPLIEGQIAWELTR
jgi:hypothetical protein